MPLPVSRAWPRPAARGSQGRRALPVSRVPGCVDRGELAGASGPSRGDGVLRGARLGRQGVFPAADAAHRIPSLAAGRRKAVTVTRRPSPTGVGLSPPGAAARSQGGLVSRVPAMPAPRRPYVPEAGPPRSAGGRGPGSEGPGPGPVRVVASVPGGRHAGPAGTRGADPHSGAREGRSYWPGRYSSGTERAAAASAPSRVAQRDSQSTMTRFCSPELAPRSCRRSRVRGA